MLREKDIKAVLSLQTQQEMKNLNILWNVMTQDFKVKDIYQTRNIEVDEFSDRSEYIKSLLKAAQYIDNVVKVKQKKVFVFCTSGICRAPTVIMAYLSYFK